MEGLDRFIYRLFRKGEIQSLTLTGKSVTAGTVLLKDASGMILLMTCTTVPSDGDAGYAKGCLVIDTNVAAGTTGLYENVGDTTACNFDAISSASPSSIALTDGKVLIGDGTGTAAEQTLSGDATVTNTGVVALAGTASGNVSANTSRAASNSVVISTNLVACASRDTSASIVESANLSTATSNNTSQSTLISTADSKAVSNSLIISTNLVAETSRDTSQSKLISTNVADIATADSKAVSVSAIASANLLAETSRDTSQSVLLSTLTSRVDSYHP